MEKQVLKAISRNRVFKGMELNRVNELLNICNCSYKSFSANQIIISERELCENMGFVISGQLGVYKTNPSGNNVLVRSIFAGDHFGEGMMFSSVRECPSTIMTLSDTDMVFIYSDDILKMCELDRIFLKNMLATLSDKILILNEKIKMLSYPTIRQRLASFLLSESEIKKSKSFKLQRTREEIASLLGATRPSISRELSNMNRQGFLRVKGKSISIENFEKLKTLL